MRINHNIGALNAWRNLTKTNRSLDKSLERLSSGLRINRAADDAAGLAISEKMRAQINGLNTAGRNAQDAISLIQTAEGALEENHAILQRVRELAVQGSSDTMTAEDRAKLQSEVDELVKELGRIGETTEFNTKKLLDGSFDGQFQIGANAGQSLQVSIDDMRASALGVTAESVSLNETVTATVGDISGGGTDDTIDDGSYAITVDSGTGNYQVVMDYTVAEDSSACTATLTSTDGKTWTDGGGAVSVTFENAVTSGSLTVASGDVTGAATVANNGLEAGEYTAQSGKLVDSNGDTVALWNGTAGTSGAYVDPADSSTVILDTGGELAADTSVAIGGIDIAGATVISDLDTAIDTVATQRSSLGAVQNRLEHTINNLATAGENLTAAESRIRDVDMAKEMTAFTRAQILSQSGTAMLAQANMRPQGVLQLLG